MAYPSGQQWGTVFIATAPITGDTSKRQPMDYSTFTSLMVDLKGANGGEYVNVGLKTEMDGDDGLEPKVRLDVTNVWKTFTIPLSSFVTGGNYPPIAP